MIRPKVDDLLSLPTPVLFLPTKSRQVQDLHFTDKTFAVSGCRWPSLAPRVPTIGFSMADRYGRARRWSKDSSSRFQALSMNFEGVEWFKPETAAGWTARIFGLLPVPAPCRAGHLRVLVGLMLALLIKYWFFGKD